MRGIVIFVLRFIIVLNGEGRTWTSWRSIHNFFGTITPRSYLRRNCFRAFARPFICTAVAAIIVAVYNSSEFQRWQFVFRGRRNSPQSFPALFPFDIGEDNLNFPSTNMFWNLQSNIISIFQFEAEARKKINVTDLNLLEKSLISTMK